MEAGLMEIVRSLNRSWIYDTYFSLCIELFIRGEMSGYRDKYLTHPTNSPKSQLLLSLNSSLNTNMGLLGQCNIKIAEWTIGFAYCSVSQTVVRGPLGAREALTGGPRENGEIIVFL